MCKYRDGGWKTEIPNPLACTYVDSVCGYVMDEECLHVLPLECGVNEVKNHKGTTEPDEARSV